MATAHLRAVAVIEAKDRSSAAFRSAAMNLKRLQAQAERTNSIMSGLNRMAAAAPVALGGVGLIAAAKESLTRFAAVERQLSRIGITGEATTERMVTAGQEVRNLAYKTGLGFNELAAGLNAGVASGQKLEEVLERMPHYARVTQATGAAMDDVVRSGTSLGRHMKIEANGMAQAFDAMAAASKEGEFESKDMAQYLPKLLPMAGAIGYRGQEGAERIFAQLQTIRAATGTSEEAANALENILAKMESKETAKNFKEAGRDLPKAFAAARKNGDDLIQTFLRELDKATKGDNSKIPQLIGDLQFGKGSRGLSQLPDLYEEVRRKMKASGGTIDKDFNRIIGDTKTKIDQTKESFDRLYTSVGNFVALSAHSTGITDGMQQAAEKLEAAAKEVNQKGLFRTIANVPERSDSILADTWAEIKENLKNVGPQEIEGADDGGFGRLQNEIAMQRHHLGKLEQSNHPRAIEQVKLIRQKISENEGKIANASAGAQWRGPYKPIDDETIMRQIPFDSHEEGNRLKGMLENIPDMKINLKRKPGTVVFSEPHGPQRPGFHDIKNQTDDDAAKKTPPSPTGPQRDSNIPLAARKLPPPGFGFGDMPDFNPDKRPEAAGKPRMELTPPVLPSPEPIAGDIKTLESPIRQAVQAMEQLQVKTGETGSKAAEITAEVQRIGPAGKQAGEAAAAGALQFQAQWMAAIDAVEARMSSMKGPNISGGGMGGFNRGASTGGVD